MPFPTDNLVMLGAKRETTERLSKNFAINQMAIVYRVDYRLRHRMETPIKSDIENFIIRADSSSLPIKKLEIRFSKWNNLRRNIFLWFQGIKIFSAESREKCTEMHFVIFEISWSRIYIRSHVK